MLVVCNKYLLLLPVQEQIENLISAPAFYDIAQPHRVFLNSHLEKNSCNAVISASVEYKPYFKDIITKRRCISLDWMSLSRYSFLLQSSTFFYPSFFPRTTFNPFLNRISGRSSVFISNDDNLISTSPRTPTLDH